MKSRFKFKSKLKNLAERMGLEDRAELTGQVQEITNKPYFQLVNNQRRFVKGILKMPVEEQARRIKELEKIIQEQEALDALKGQA
jgi:hypothetical protein